MDRGLSGKLPEAGRRQQHAEPLTIVESLPIATVVVDRQLRVHRVNRAARELVARSTAEMLGTSLDQALGCCGCSADLDSADAAPHQPCGQFPGRCALTDAVVKTFETGIGMRRILVALELSVNGEALKKKVALDTSPVLCNGQDCVILCVQDCTEGSDLQAELLHAQKIATLGQLACGAVHDLNNLLAVVLCYCDLAHAALPHGNPIHNDVEQIAKAGQSAAILTRQLLSLSQKHSAMPEPVDVNATVISMEKMLRRLLGVDIRIVSSLAGSLPPVLVVPGHLEQIIMNLAVNARDAMPDGGTLFISTSRVQLGRAEAATLGVEPGHYVELGVRDTGFGMESEMARKVFEPFFTTKNDTNGTGLGLSTVSGIVERAGGSIDIDTQVGEGSTFRVVLPRAHVGRRLSRAVQGPPADVRGTETVLVVEDDHALRRLICRILREHGFEVLEAANAGEALLMCGRSSEHVDLPLTDTVLPHMSGPELAQRLRKVEKHLKVLYMTDHTESERVQRVLRRNPAAVLHKPFNPQQLLYRIRQTVDSTRPQTTPLQ